MLPELMAAIAERCRTLPGVAGASYPVLNHVPESPWIMVRQADEGATYEKRRLGSQIGGASIDVVVLVTSTREAPRDASRLDIFPELILDAFDASLTGGAAAELVPTLVLAPGDQLQHVWREAEVLRATATWGTQFCYAAIIRLDPVFERRPQEIAP